MVTLRKDYTLNMKSVTNALDLHGSYTLTPTLTHTLSLSLILAHSAGPNAQRPGHSPPAAAADPSLGVAGCPRAGSAAWWGCRCRRAGKGR